MKGISIQDATMFVLIAVIFVSLAYFSSGVNENIRSVLADRQQAQIANIQSTNLNNNLAINAVRPLVILSAEPALVTTGDTSILTWTIADNSAVRCVAVSNPRDNSWFGQKNSSSGTYTQKTSPITQDAVYIIQCVDNKGHVSTSEMTILLR